MEKYNLIGVAVKLSEYAERHLSVKDIEEMTDALPSNVYDCDEQNGMGEDLVYLENLCDTVHSDFLVIEPHQSNL